MHVNMFKRHASGLESRKGIGNSADVSSSAESRELVFRCDLPLYSRASFSSSSSSSSSSSTDSSMEASSLSTASRGCFYSSTEILLSKKVRLHARNRSLVSIMPTGRTVQPLSSRTGPLIQTKRVVKVLCSQKKEVTILEAGHMDEIYDALAKRIVPTAAVASSPDSKHIVGLAGPPGAGKTTLAYEVVRRVNKLWPEKASAFDSQVVPPDVATVVPMDGFHLYRSELDAMENPEEAHARRGAPWTFNPTSMLACLTKLRNEGSVYAPSFDHGVGDPVEDDIFVSLQHKVVIVEGNYLFLDEGVWKDVSSMFDEKWFIEVDIDKSMQRVLKRHISTGKAPDVAKWRIEYNDRPNAELIINSKKNADLVIKSVDIQR